MTDTSTNKPPFATVADGQAAIQAHPACDKFMITPMQFVVFYPPSYTVPGGTSAVRGRDDLSALNLLYQRIDNFWSSQRLQIPS